MEQANFIDPFLVNTTFDDADESAEALPMNSRLHRISGCAALALAGAVLTSPPVADGMRGSIKDAPKKEERRCTLSANVALATEYVFRGFRLLTEFVSPVASIV